MNNEGFCKANKFVINGAVQSDQIYSYRLKVLRYLFLMNSNDRFSAKSLYHTTFQKI
jgi:hypothetical protein